MQRDRAYIVDEIIKETNDTVSFLSAGVLQFSVSQVKKMPERDAQGGQYIIVTDVSERQFWFDIWELLNLNGTRYTRLDIEDADINDQYQERINEVYIALCNDLFRGCCGDENAASLLFFDTFDDFPASGSANTLYVATLEGQQGQYFWNGTEYVASFYPHCSLTMYALNNFL